jgi:two-component system alkaline phosphatase synthesis response regulator PhoP
MAYKILVVDDEKTLVDTVKAYMENEGYAVRSALDGPAAVREARAFRPDLVVLDIMLPGMDGLEVLRQLRQETRDSQLQDVYVIMLTAKADETDKIVGLTMGADDYMTKPFSPRELVARVKAALRRIGGQVPAKSNLVFKRIRVDVDARLVWKGEQPIELTPIEFDLLHVLVRNAGRALSREQLIEQVWGYDYYGDDRVVTQDVP